MKNLFKYTIALLGLISVSGLKAQQDVMFTQYMFNGLTLNPAYAGSHDAISTNLIWRKQWLKIDGAPQSTGFSIHSPLGGDKIALGFQAVHDKIGLSKNTYANLSAAYILPVSAKGKLSFGLSGGLDNNQFNFDDLYQGVNGDPNLSSANNFNEVKPNFGAGVYFYTDKTFIGGSIPRLISNDFGDSVYTQSRHIFVYVGHVFDLHPNLKFKPNVLIKMSQNTRTSIDLNANFLFIDKLWLGLSYRTFESLDFIAQVQVTDQLGIGYAYDYTLNPLKDYTSGSHEVMLSYLFSFRKSAMLSPRYF